MDSDGWLALAGVVIVSALLGIGAMVETVVTRTSRSRVLAALGMPVETGGRQRFRLTSDPRHRLVAAMVLVQIVSAIVVVVNTGLALWLAPRREYTDIVSED